MKDKDYMYACLKFGEKLLEEYFGVHEFQNLLSDLERGSDEWTNYIPRWKWLTQLIEWW